MNNASGYFVVGDVPHNFKDAVAECAAIRDCYNRRIPFQVDELPEVKDWATTPPPLMEGQMIWSPRYNKLSGQVEGTTRALAVKRGGELHWVFYEEQPAASTRNYPCD